MRKKPKTLLQKMKEEDKIIEIAKSFGVDNDYNKMLKCFIDIKICFVVFKYFNGVGIKDAMRLVDISNREVKESQGKTMNRILKMR